MLASSIRRRALVATASVMAAVGGALLASGIDTAVSAAQHEPPAALIEPVGTEPATTAPSATPPAARPHAVQEAASRPEQDQPSPAGREAPSTSRKPAEPRTVRISPVTALYSQAAVDTGALVTWMTSPTCLLAGHNTMGWAWMDDLPNGTRVRVLTGPCAGLYEVYAHRSQSQKGGPVPAWMSGPDLVLQTCKTRGMGFSLARRL
jgi:hypothetical protein